jgi:hypothetical protein
MKCYKSALLLDKNVTDHIWCSRFSCIAFLSQLNVKFIFLFVFLTYIYIYIYIYANILRPQIRLLIQLHYIYKHYPLASQLVSHLSLDDSTVV